MELDECIVRIKIFDDTHSIKFMCAWEMWDHDSIDRRVTIKSKFQSDVWSFSACNELFVCLNPILLKRNLEPLYERFDCIMKWFFMHILFIHRCIAYMNSSSMVCWLRQITVANGAHQQHRLLYFKEVFCKKYISQNSDVALITICILLLLVNSIKSK